MVRCVCLHCRAVLHNVAVAPHAGIQLRVLCAVHDLVARERKHLNHVRVRSIEESHNLIGCIFAVGYWKDKNEIKENWQIGAVFEPDMEEEKRRALLKGWKKAVKCALVWAQED